jgi:hypothetical protein
MSTRRSGEGNRATGDCVAFFSGEDGGGKDPNHRGATGESQLRALHG